MVSFVMAVYDLVVAPADRGQKMPPNWPLVSLLLHWEFLFRKKTWKWVDRSCMFIIDHKLIAAAG